MTRLPALRRVAAAAALLLGCWLAVVAASILTVAKRSDAGSADVAIVLGAALHGGTPSPVFAARIDHGVSLVRQGRARILLLTGGRGEGSRIAESAAARRYAIARGIPPDRILIEARSRTTLQNLVEARKVMAGAGLHSAFIISDPLHMKRALAMAGNLHLVARASPTEHSRFRSWRSKLPFLLRELYFLHHYWLFGQ